MRKSSPQPLNMLFDDAHSLRNVQQRAIALAKLNQALKSLLPISLQNQCRAANYRNSRLIVEVSSASWLTRLRYEQEKLLSSLRCHILPALCAIDFVINPALNSARYIARSNDIDQNAPPSFERTLSPHSAQMLESLAQNCPNNLKQKLIKLAQHAKKTNNDS